MFIRKTILLSSLFRIMEKALKKNTFQKYSTVIIKCQEVLKEAEQDYDSLFQKNLLKHKAAKYGRRAALAKEVGLGLNLKLHKILQNKFIRIRDEVEEGFKIGFIFFLI